MPVTQPSELFNIRTLASYLGVTVKSIYGARHRGDMAPGFKVGRELRWRRQDVETWIERRVESDGR